MAPPTFIVLLAVAWTPQPILMRTVTATVPRFARRNNPQVSASLSGQLSRAIWTRGQHKLHTLGKPIRLSLYLDQTHSERLKHGVGAVRDA